MNPKKRLMMSLHGEKVDRPPCICPGGMMNMVTAELMRKTGIYLPEAHTDARKMADLAKAVYENSCFENCGVPFCMTIEAEELGAKVDLGNESYEPHVIEYAMESVSEYQELKPIDLTQGRAKVVLDALGILKKEVKDIPIIGNLTGPISTASSVIEPVVFYKELRKKNAEAHAYLNFVTEQLIAFGRAQVAAGADVITIADPSGTGEILGPKYFKEFAVTYINQLLDGLKDLHVETIVHICGYMKNVYKEVNEVRSNALSFDSAVPMTDARRNLADRVLMGNVSTYTLEFGNEDTIRKLSGNCIKCGTNIVSPACGLGMNSPLRNIQALLASVEESDG